MGYLTLAQRKCKECVNYKPIPNSNTIDPIYSCCKWTCDFSPKEEPIPPHLENTLSPHDKED